MEMNKELKKYLSTKNSSCIIVGVPCEHIMGVELRRYRNESTLDIILDSNGNYDGFMPSSDKLYYFSRFHPDLKKIHFCNKNLIGGKLL